MSNSPERSNERAVAGCPGWFTAFEHGTGRFRLVGELDPVAVAAVRDHFGRLGADVELECSEITFMDSSGLHLVLAIQAGCEAADGRLVLVNPSWCVVRVLALCGLDTVLETRVDDSWPGR